MTEHGKSWIDSLFDKAEDAIGIVEKFAGDDGVLPVTFDDGSRIVADSMAGGAGQTEKRVPAWIVLRFIQPDGTSFTRRYLREETKARPLIELGETP